MGTMLDESVVRNGYNALCARIGEERAYRTLVLKFHPDRGYEPNAIAFQHLEKICETFKDNKKRTKELEGQAMERQEKKKEMDELAAKKQCSLTNLEKLRAAAEKERQRRQRAQDRKTARMNAESGGAIAPVVAPPGSNETLTEPCSPATEKEVSAPTTGVTFTAEQEDVATILDTSLPPNTAALAILNGIVCDLNNGTLKVPMNGDKEYVQSTITGKKIHPIRMLLQNQLVPIPSDEPDFWTILDMVDKQNIPKSTHLHKKLPSAIKFFRELRELNPSLQCTTDDVLPDALCDTTVSPPVETIESDATPPPDAPPVPLQEDAPDATPMSSVQEDASLPLGAPPQPATETKSPSRKNRKATMEVTRPQKKQKSSDTETAPNGNAFFDAMWERVLPKLMAKKKSVADYVKMAKRCTNGEETTFPPVQTVDELLNACLKFKGNTFDDITSRSQRNRIKKVIIAVTDYVERVGFDAARDYFHNGAETAHQVSCA